MKVFKVLLIVGATLLVCFGSCVGYVGYKAQRAKTLVAEFCASVSVGQPSAGLAERAQASGLHVAEIPDRPEEGAPPSSTLICSQGVFLARHLCQVKISAGQVLKVERGFID